MNEKDYNEVEVYDENRVDKKDIDITKTPWYKIVKFAVATIAEDDPYIRAKFCPKRKTSTEPRVLIEDKEGEVVEVVDDEE
jgi:hypothetical protein|nr:MAG TPA: hypothetical protein [Caudoviricetes sp.]